MSNLDTKMIADVLGVSKKTVLERAKTEGWAFIAKGNALQWLENSLPADVKLKLVARTTSPVVAQTPQKTGLFTAASERSRQKAMDRALFLKTMGQQVKRGELSVADFVDAYNAGFVLPGLKVRLGEVSVPTVYRWQAEWRDKDQSIDALVPLYGLSDRKKTRLTSEEQAILAGSYLTPQRWSMAHCYNVLKINLPRSEASLTQARRYLNSLPKPLVDLRRMGRERFENLYLPDLDRNPLLYDSMQQVVSDHHCLDFLVHRNGQNFRPWITTFQDYRSGKIVGWCPSIYPSSISIGAAFVRMVSVHGAPGLVHIDNGRDYKSRMFRGFEVPMRIFNSDGNEDDALVQICGVFEVCGAQKAYARPYHGKSKGRQERTFGMFAQYFSREFPTYLGSDVTERTDDSELYFRSIKGKAKKPVEVSWDDFIRKLEAFVPYWDSTWRGQGKGREDKTSDEVFAEGWKGKKEVDPQMLEMVFGQPEIRVVRKTMVEIGGGKYYHENLMEYNGRQVVARRLIHDPDSVMVTHPEGGLIARAVYNPFEDTGDMDTNLRNLNRARRDLKAKERLMISAAPMKKSAGFLGKALEAFAQPIHKVDLPKPEPKALPVAAGAEGDHHPAPQGNTDNLISFLDAEPVRPVQTSIKDFLTE